MTRIPVPRTKAEEIRELLRPFVASRSLPDEFTLSRFKKEIERGRAIDPVNAYLAAGAIAVLEWNENSLDWSYQNALKFDASADVLEEYATSLQMLGNYESAAEKARLASEKSPTDLTALRRAISYTFIAGEVDMAESLCDVYALRAPTAPLDRANPIRHANMAFRASSTSPEHVKKCNSIAFKMLRDRKIPFKRIHYETDLQDSGVMLIIDIVLGKDEVTVLDRELGDRLFDEVEDFHPGKYWVGYEQAEECA
jgi:hypothetical protein